MPSCCLLGPGCFPGAVGEEFLPPGPSHRYPSRTSPVPQEPGREIGQMNHFLRVPILGLHFKRQHVTLHTLAPELTMSTPPGTGTWRRGKNPTPSSQFCPPVPPQRSQRAIWSKALGRGEAGQGAGKWGHAFPALPAPADTEHSTGRRFWVPRTPGEIEKANPCQNKAGTRKERGAGWY